MASSYDALRSAKETAEQSRNYWRDEAEKLTLKNRALRGHLTRLKKRAPANATPN